MIFKIYFYINIGTPPNNLEMRYIFIFGFQGKELLIGSLLNPEILITNAMIESRHNEIFLNVESCV